MKVENVRIYDLEESLIASGYPMRTMATQDRDLDEKDIKRGHNLSKACDTGNGAHGQFMTGIRVSFDLTCTNKMWVEAERYRFLEFVSSQSTMHCLLKFDISTQCVEDTNPEEMCAHCIDCFLAENNISDYGADDMYVEINDYGIKNSQIKVKIITFSCQSANIFAATNENSRL